MTISALDATGLADLGGTATSIRAAQRDDGMIPWFAGGNADPWNHVEAAMALTVAGEVDAARSAFGWLRGNQRADGSWLASYHWDGSDGANHVDTNAVAYVATGAHHHLIATGDVGFAQTMFPIVEPALDFVSALVDGEGKLAWSVGVDGTPADGALLAGSSSACQSLRAGAALAVALGIERPGWAETATRIEARITRREREFLDKSVFAMDWYYPVLAGVLDRQTSQDRLDAREERFVDPGRGVRCRADGRWVTAAETAECAIAYWRAGNKGEAMTLLAWTGEMRDEDGSYLTGLVHPERSEFPPGERTTYSAAAIILATDVCRGGASAAVFSPLG